MPAISASKCIVTIKTLTSFPPSSIPAQCLSLCPPLCRKFPTYARTLVPPLSRRKTLFLCKSSEIELSAADIEWLEKLPDRKKPLYSHSLPCIEAWLKKLGFRQSREDRGVWLIEKPDWHAQLSLDVTDLYIRACVGCGFDFCEDSQLRCLFLQDEIYLKSGPGDLEKDIERRFSYALSREDIENAILGGP